MTRNSASTESIYVELDQSLRPRIVGGASDADLVAASVLVANNLETLTENSIIRDESESDTEVDNFHDSNSHQRPSHSNWDPVSVPTNSRALPPTVQAIDEANIVNIDQGNFQPPAIELRTSEPTVQAIVVEAPASPNQANIIGNLIVNQGDTREEPMANFTAKDLSDLIPRYDGKFENLESFIGTVSMLEAEVRAQDKRMFLLMIRAKLFGKAYDAIKFATDLNSWERVKETLTNNIAPPVNAQTAQSQLFKACQGPTETVRAFSDRIKSYVNVLNKIQCKDVPEDVGTHIQNNNAQTAKNVFEDGLLDSRLKTILISANKATLDEAIITALEQEGRLPARRSGSSLFCKSCRNEGHTADRCTNKHQRNNGSSNANGNPQNPPAQANAVNQIHNPSRQPQHTGNPAAPAPQPTGEQINNPNGPPRSYANIRCNYCKQLGHIIRDCPTRPPRPVTVVRTEEDGQPLGPEPSGSGNA